MENELEERSSLESILEYGQLLWHWAWLLALAALLTGAATYYVASRQPPVYASRTKVVVIAGSSSIYDTNASTYYSQSLAEVYSQTMTSTSILDKVSERLGYPVNSSISVTQLEYKPIIDILVQDADPQVAADVANTLFAVFSEKVLNDQTSKYSGLRADIESDIAEVDRQLEVINEKLANLSIKFSDIDAAQRKAEESRNVGVVPAIVPTKDPADIAEQARLQLAQSQYQNTRYSLYSNLQQLKYTESLAKNSIDQLNPAIPNMTPVRPQPMRSAMLASLVGLLIAAAVVFLVAFLQDEIHDPEEITRKWGIPVLGMISSYNYHQSPLVTLSQPRSPVSEAFRSLRTSLQYSGVDNPLRTLLITSATPSEGKTSISANLATVMAQSERNVMVLDCDLRRPRIHKVFQVSNRIGLSDYFIRTSDRMDGVIKKTENPRVSVITSGSLPPNPSELLNSTRMNEVIDLLSQHFDHIVLDTPPLLAVTDALVLAPRVDGVILVIDPKRSKRAAVKHAIGQLKSVNANLLGVVLNNIKSKNSRYYYNKNYYYDSEHKKIIDRPTESTNL